LIKRSKKEWLRQNKTKIGEATLFLFLTKSTSCKVKLILPALADPAVAGDHAYPVLLRYNNNFLG